MQIKDFDIEMLKKNAVKAIHQSFTSPDTENDVTLFISHHIDVIEKSYWIKHVGTQNPSPEQVLKLIEYRDNSYLYDDEEEDQPDYIDFTLPDDTTDYVICVEFDDHGQICDIRMES